ncbi:MAG: hypothetical protein U9N77_16330, partial [Thermodesulfobacteriota bacterium]|nr:hypothetical protein [Thermodesulfobacteriota bacterium]
EKETVDVSITKKDIEMLLDEYRRTSRIKGVEVCSTRVIQMTQTYKIDFKNSSKIIILASSPPETSTGKKLAGEILKKNDPIFSTLENTAYGYYLHYVAYNDVETLIKYKKERKKEFEIKKTEGIKEFEIKKTEGINIPSYIMPFSGKTDSYWKDLEPQGKKYLIIRMEPGNFVRNAGKAKEELSADDVNGKFPILDGIDYKSNNADHVLYYMEV